MSLRSSTPKRGMRILSTLAVTAGLFTGAAGLASAASGKGHATTNHATKSQPKDSPKRQSPTRANFHPGVVTAVTSSAITLTLPDSLSATYTINSATVIEDHDVAKTVADITLGSPVAVISSHTDASLAAKILLGVPGKDAPGAHQPRLGGQVVAVSATTITVADRDGFWRTINTSSTTTYSDASGATTRDAVAVGQFVGATGTVDADHTSLDAASVQVSATAPLHGPDGGHGGPGLEPGGPRR